MAINRRKLYVNGFDTILASTGDKTTLKAWCAAKSIDTLLLYNLNTILASTSLKTQLAAFLIDLRTNTSILNIYAARGNYPLPYAGSPAYGYTDMNTYNNAQSDAKARIGTYDAGTTTGGMISEYEWYLNYSTDATINANTQLARFEDFILLLNNNINWRNNFNAQFAGTQGAPRAEIYIGQFKPVGNELKQAKRMTSYYNNSNTVLTPRNDKINLSCYVDCDAGSYGTNYAIFFNWIKTRLTWFAKAMAAGYFNVAAGQKMAWCPIFSIEPTFMQYAASTTGGNKTFDTIFNDMNTQWDAWIAAGSADALLVSQYITKATEYTLFAYSHAFTARPSTSTP